jgi:hypothetical protein
MKWMLHGVLAMGLLMAGCGDRQKDATEEAINAAQSAINAVRAEAEKYVPEQLDAAQKTLQSAKDALVKGDYQSALSGAKEAAKRARDMAVSAAGTREEWKKNWNELNESIPKSMEQVKNRLEAYSRGARLPSGMDKDMLEQAKVQYAQLREKWTEATAAARQDNFRDAIEKSTGLKEALAQLKELLGFKPEKPKSESAN